MKLLIIILGKTLLFIDRLNNYARKEYRKTLFKKIGNEVYIGNNCTFTEKNISIGDFVSIGKLCCFQSTHGEIIIGNNVMFGPNVHIHGGNHVIDKIGELMSNVDTKKIGDDSFVIIEDDCWIGACSIILKGVTIGRGSVIGAGSIVTHNIEKYSIYTGCPTQKTRRRFNELEIAEHELCFKNNK